VFEGGEADLSISKSNDAGGNLQLGTPFTWTLSISNSGFSSANFNDGQAILTDTLPLSATYGTPVVTNVVDVLNSNRVNCTINNKDLSCRASGGDVSVLAHNGSFEVTIQVTPTITSSLQNPRRGGLCQIDPDGVVTKENEANNNCNDTAGAALSRTFLPVILKKG
jgi:hypothetical protein